MSRHEVLSIANGIRLIEAIPDSSNTFTDTDLVELMSTALLTTVVPLIKAAKADFFTMTKDYIISEDSRIIDIPPEAVGLSVRDVMSVASDGSVVVIPLLDLNELQHNTNGYTIRNNQITINHRYLQSNTVRIDYYTRPASLSLTEYGKVIAKQAVVDPLDAFATITLNQKPESWQVDPIISIISKTMPFVTIDINIDIIPGDPLDVTITVPIEAFNKIKVGDYLCTPDCAPVIQYVPFEAYQLVKQLAAVACLESLGDKDGWKIATQTASDLKTGLLTMIMPRTETQNKTMSSRNGISNWR